MDKELQELRSRLERTEAAAIAHAAVLAAVIAHHPLGDAVRDSLERMTDAAQTKLLFGDRPDRFAAQLQRSVHDVLLLAERHAEGMPPTGSGRT